MVKRKKTEDILMNTDADDISMLAEIQTDTDDLSAIEFEKEIPIMPLRNMVMFPSVVMPVTIGRPSTLKLVNAAYKKKQAIAVVCQVQGDLDDPGFADLYHVGVIAKILRIFEMPGGNTTVIMQSNGPKIHLDNITKTIPYLKGTVTAINENNEEQDSDEFKALTDTCKDLTAKFIDVSEKLSPDTVFAIKNLDNPEILVNFISSNFPFTVEEKIELLKYDVLKERMYRLIQILNREVQLAEIKASIQMRAREDIDQQQREYFLQQQIKTIQDELGGGGQEQEIEEMRQKAERMRWNAEVRETFMKELAKLERTHPQSPDYSVQLNYLQTMLNLPWGTYTTDNLNLKNAEKTLNKDHYGLEKVKERITDALEKTLSVDYDKNRLEQELIYYIEKLDVNEEKQRLSNHLKYFISTMESGNGQGKKLGFIAQEMGREINTLGSKSNHAEMQKIVVQMKDELEQIKEQVLNVM